MARFLTRVLELRDGKGVAGAARFPHVRRTSEEAADAREPRARAAIAFVAGGRIEDCFRNACGS